MAAGDVTQTVLFCRTLLTELGFAPQGPTQILTDSKSAIAIAADPVAHKRTKHINIRYHFIRQHSICRRMTQSELKVTTILHGQTVKVHPPQKVKKSTFFTKIQKNSKI